MIRHYVHMRFNTVVTDDQRATVFADLAGLSDHLDGMLDFQHRINESPETPLVRDFNDVFWIDFTDARARDVYLDHPMHRAIGARLVGMTQGGPAGIFVCDVLL